MNVVARVIPLRLHSDYSGTNGQGESYTIGSWIVKGVLDGKEFMLKAFTADHLYLQEHINLEVDLSFEITGKPWNNKYFNEFMIKTITKPAVVQDVPGGPVIQNSVAQAPPPSQSNSLNINPGEPNDLPF